MTRTRSLFTLVVLFSVGCSPSVNSFPEDDDKKKRLLEIVENCAQANNTYERLAFFSKEFSERTLSRVLDEEDSDAIVRILSSTNSLMGKCRDVPKVPLRVRTRRGNGDDYLGLLLIRQNSGEMVEYVFKFTFEHGAGYRITGLYFDYAPKKSQPDQLPEF